MAMLDARRSGAEGDNVSDNIWFRAAWPHVRKHCQGIVQPRALAANTDRRTVNDHHCRTTGACPSICPKAHAAPLTSAGGCKASDHTEVQTPQPHIREYIIRRVQMTAFRMSANGRMSANVPKASRHRAPSSQVPMAARQVTTIRSRQRARREHTPTRGGRVKQAHTHAPHNTLSQGEGGGEGRKKAKEAGAPDHGSADSTTLRKKGSSAGWPSASATIATSRCCCSCNSRWAVDAKQRDTMAAARFQTAAVTS